MPVDVVVVNYKTPDLLKDFCESYEASKFTGCTLTIVEVESDHILFPQYTTLCYNANIGFGKAANRGAQLGHNQVILIANSDTLLTPDLIVCYDALLSNEDWGVLGPRQIDERGHITAGGIFGPDQSPRQRSWNETDVGQCSDICDDVLSVSGSLYFIKRAVWNKLTECPLFQQIQPGSVGAFLETQHYFEEMFCSLHARAHGFKCVFYGPVQMTHLFHRSHPHGSWQDLEFARSQAMHREACALHGIVSE